MEKFITDYIMSGVILCGSFGILGTIYLLRLDYHATKRSNSKALKAMNYVYRELDNTRKSISQIIDVQIDNEVKGVIFIVTSVLVNIIIWPIATLIHMKKIKKIHDIVKGKQES